MESKAIPLVVFEKGEFHVTQESLEFLQKITGKISVIAVVGKYRTGKSFLLNRIILNNRGKTGFGVGPTINPCTKGLWIWSEGVEIDLDGEKVTVLVIDSEGLGAFDEDANHDTRIFLLALLLSSYFIYNSVGSIDESALQNLSLIVNLSKQIQVKSGTTTIDDISTYFPSFLWILRDFALKLIDSTGNPISTKEYLENALTPTKGISDNVEAKNRIRRLLTSFFTDRDCFALVRPTESEKALQRLDQAEDNVFRPEFLEMAQKLRRHIFRKVKVKTLNKACLTGEMLGHLACTYVETINKGGVPNIEGAWSSVCHAECMKNIDECLGDMEQSLRKLPYPMSDIEFKTNFKQLQENILKKFKEKAIGESIDSYMKTLSGKIKERKAIHIQKNRRIHEEKLQREMQEWFITIQDKLRDGEIITMQDFKVQMDNYNKTTVENAVPPSLKHKCFEYFLEYQQIVAETISRNISTELQNEIRKTNSQLELANDQFQRKKNEFENEKEYFKNKNEEIERECSTHKGNNAILSARNEELLREKKRTEENYEERLQYLKETSSEKLIELKEKYNKVTAKLNETETKYSKNLAEVQKENLLLKQESEFKSKEIFDLKERNQSLENLLRDMRKKNKSIEETDRREENCDWAAEKQFLKSQVESLKAHVEDNKTIQEALMAALNAKAVENPQNIDKAYENTNKHLSFALEKSEENCKKLEQKLQKLKKFQKIVKNCSSLQCKNCSKNHSVMNFIQHTSKCEGAVKEITTLLVSISRTTINETENKPFTEYLITTTSSGKTITTIRKYKMFCNLHLGLQQQFPHIDLPELFSTVSAPSKHKLVEERRKNFENYLVQLSQIATIKESSIFRKFIGIESDAVPSGRYSESPLQSRRGKINIEMITSRAFSPSRSILSPLTNTFENKHWE